MVPGTSMEGGRATTDGNISEAASAAFSFCLGAQHLGSPPILLGFARHRWRFRIFDLHPMR
jgi:hypothetical protein